MTRGEPDAEVVQRHIGALRQALANLRRHAGLTVEELRGDSDLRWIVERGLQLTIQNALDIATHFSASSGLDAPDYATAIDRLSELSVISSGLATRLRPMAGFRNVLVHAYLDVDLGILQRILSEHITDLESFADSVEAYIEQA